MKRIGRAVVGTVLVLVGVGGVAVGLGSGRSAASGPAYQSEQVTRGTVEKSISDSGTVVDQYVYSIAPEAAPQLVEHDGTTVTQASGVRGYTVSSVEVAPGETVKAGAVIAVVRNADDESVDVTAPYDGRIRTVAAAGSGATAATVATLGVGRAEVVVQVSEFDVVRLAVDQNARLRLDASGVTFDGTVASIGQVAKTASGVQTYQVVVRTSALPAGARSGMTVSTTITVTTAASVLSVPLTAVGSTNDDTTVQVLDDAGAVQTVSVQVGLVGDTRVEITRGLTAGQRVVTGTDQAAAATGGGIFPPQPGAAAPTGQ